MTLSGTLIRWSRVVIEKEKQLDSMAWPLATRKRVYTAGLVHGRLYLLLIFLVFSLRLLDLVGKLLHLFVQSSKGFTS